MNTKALVTIILLAMVVGEHDSGNNYYCTFRSSPRPLCGSCAMHEAWCNKEGRMTDRAFAKGV